MIVIRFANPRGIDFPYLLSMIHASFMSRPNVIVVPGACGAVLFAVSPVIFSGDVPPPLWIGKGIVATSSPLLPATGGQRACAPIYGWCQGSRSWLPSRFSRLP